MRVEIFDPLPDKKMLVSKERASEFEGLNIIEKKIDPNKVRIIKKQTRRMVPPILLLCFPTNLEYYQFDVAVKLLRG